MDYESNGSSSRFLEFMGASPIMKIMDYLLTYRDVDFSITDIADNSNVGRATLYRIWEDLEKNEMIIHTRVIGRSKLFKLNMANPRVQKLAELYDFLLFESVPVKLERPKSKTRRKKLLA